MRTIGIHLRLTGSILHVMHKAVRLGVPLFQCFLVPKATGRLVKVSWREKKEFLELRRKHFKDMYVHGSYWINLASIKHTIHRALERELQLAKELEFTHMILHPGSAKGAKRRDEGIDALARALNHALKTEHDVKIVLENTAHGGMSVGGDLKDFERLLPKLDYPEKISFCIDTAHAYSYGYNIRTATGRDQFIDELDRAVGIERVALLHLNDTYEELASKLDRHQMIGKGTIGEDALREFVLHEKLANIPVLMELPVAPDEEEAAMLKQVRGWHE